MLVAIGVFLYYSVWVMILVSVCVLTHAHLWCVLNHVHVWCVSFMGVHNNKFLIGTYPMSSCDYVVPYLGLAWSRIYPNGGCV